jgi:predicted GH43/DUF377 family glycosyl hydrolase
MTQEGAIFSYLINKKYEKSHTQQHIPVFKLLNFYFFPFFFTLSKKTLDQYQTASNSLSVYIRNMIRAATVTSLVAAYASGEYAVKVTERSVTPSVAYVDGTSKYTFVFNPTWVEATANTGGKSGLLIRTQDCPADVGGECVFCGGSEAKASILTFAELQSDGEFSYVDEKSVVYGPGDESDTWGTEDPRMQYNAADGQYYMFYTAYNGSSILLSLATTPDPTSSQKWTRHGAVFPNNQNSKSGALLLRPSPPHYLLWGDQTIRIAKSDDPTVWPDIGDVFLQTRPDSWDSQLVESGPPPLLLSSGDYLFFYNSATTGWPTAEDTAYHPGWVILDKDDPSVILQRSEDPLMGPEYAWDKGDAPYTCNVPNVVFLEAARTVELKEGRDVFEVYFGGADAVIGSATIEVTY